MRKGCLGESAANVMKTLGRYPNYHTYQTTQPTVGTHLESTTVVERPTVVETPTVATCK